MSDVAPLDRYNIMDLELYPNYFLAQFLNQDGELFSFEMYDGHPLDIDGLDEMIHSAPMITFNGDNYDIPILSLAMKGADNDLLKVANDHIIVGNLKPWAFYRHYKLTQPLWNHIDINNVAPGVMVSLKMYGARMHMKLLQDLPYDPDTSLSTKQMEDVKEYCVNDLVTTDQLFKGISERVELRRAMSYQYHVDLRSKSDAQIAESVLKAELCRMTNKVIGKISVREKEFYYKKPDYILFKTPYLQSILEMVLRSPFTAKTNGQIEMTDELSGLRIAHIGSPEQHDISIPIGGTTYKFGIGGIHSQETCKAVVADDEHDVYDDDFTSYYPFIILNNELYPENLGRAFLDVYRAIVEQRLEAKRTGDKAVAESLKITINGTFGKLGSIYSPLYAPDLMIAVTITGQLTLLMLIERFELAGISVVSANTDGIVTRCPKTKRDEMLDIITGFEALTNYKLEETHYRALYSRDVNNYIAIGMDGKVKTKGTFSPGSLLKNPENDICAEAVIEYLMSDKRWQETIRECTDIRKFISTRTVRGGGYYGEMYLGRVVRWYYSTDSSHHIHYRTSGNKVPRTDGCYPIMNLPEFFPEDVNYAWYDQECVELLMDIGVITRPTVLKKTRAKKGI